MIRIPCMLVVISALLVGCQPEPNTYEDCVLRKINQDTEKEVAQLIRKTCEEKFRPTIPFERPPVLEIPADLLPSISLEAYLDDKPPARDIHTNNVVEPQRTFLVGSVHNGLKDWQITSFVVAVGFGREPKNYKTYTVEDLYLYPFKMEDIKIRVESMRYDIPRHEYAWAIGRVFGYKLTKD